MKAKRKRGREASTRVSVKTKEKADEGKTNHIMITG